MTRIDESAVFISVRIAILTVSDSRGSSEDRSGDVLVGRLTEAGHSLADRSELISERGEIAAVLRAWWDYPDIYGGISTCGTSFMGLVVR